MRDRLLAYAREQLNTDPEMLWEKYPDYAVLRHTENQKWYAIFMRVQGDKLFRGSEHPALAEPTPASFSTFYGEFPANEAPADADDPDGTADIAYDPDRMYDILDIKLDPVMIDSLRGLPGYLPAYHMNKKSWLTVLLDGTIPCEEVLELLNISFDITAGKQKGKGVLASCHDWLIPANPKYYDVEAAFQREKIILWKQSSHVSVGDTVYMYEGAPWSCLRFRCRAVEVNIPYKKKKDGSPVKIRQAMRIELLETYPPDYMPLSRLRDEYGVYSVRGPRSTPPALLSELRARAMLVQGQALH